MVQYFNVNKYICLFPDDPEEHGLPNENRSFAKILFGSILSCSINYLEGDLKSMPGQRGCSRFYH